MIVNTLLSEVLLCFQGANSSFSGVTWWEDRGIDEEEKLLCFLRSALRNPTPELGVLAHLHT